MYKIETHLHTAEGSRCSRLTAADMIGRYHAAGYHTVFVSDHFQKTHLDERGENWAQRIDSFLTGYRNAKAEGDKLGVSVLLSAEFGFVKHPNHYLIYGFDESFLINGEHIPEMDPAEFLADARARGFLVIQAHPYRDGHCVPKPEWVDGMEVCNTNPRHENYDDKCEAIVAEHGLYRTAGSDAHRPEDVAGAVTASLFPVDTVEEFIRLIKSGEAIVGPNR